MADTSHLKPGQRAQVAPSGEDHAHPGPKVYVQVALWLALAAIQKGDHHGLRVWLMATALLGMVFISGQVYESRSS